MQAFALCLGAVPLLAAAPLAAQTHHFVYISSTGAAGSAISGFELNPTAGTLTAIAGSPFNESLDAGAMALNPSGSCLYVLNSTAKSVSAFAVDCATGVLSELAASPFSVGAAGFTPRMFLVESSGKYLYVASTDDASGTITSLSWYAIDQSTGALSSAAAGSYSPGVFTPASFVSKRNDHFLYLAGSNSTNAVSIVALELDPSTGTPAGVHFYGQGSFARSAAVDSQGRFLFVGRGSSAGSVDSYAIAADGSLQLSSSFSLGPQLFPYALAGDASGAYFYAAVAGAGIRFFSVNASGALTELPGSPLSGVPVSSSAVMEADPAAQSLYYQQRAFAISAQGALNELSASPLTVTGSVAGIAAANPLDQQPVAPISAPVTSLLPLSLQFSDQNIGSASASRSISLSNSGSAPLILSGISLTGSNASEFGLSHDCVAVLPASGGCTITITFQPQFEGLRQAALTIVDNSSASLAHSVALSGTGRLPFAIGLDSSTGAIAAGQMAEYDLRLVPAAGFIGRVSLACSGAPDQATCDVPPSMDLSGVAKTFSVRVSTKARPSLAPSARHFYPAIGGDYFRRILALGAVLTFLSLLLPRRRLKIQCAAALLLVCVSLSLVSCSGVAGAGTSTSATAAPSPAGSGTPAGQYALTLTATSGSAAVNFPLNLAVQ